MSLKNNLIKEITNIFKTKWKERDGKKVPESEDLKLNNDAIKLKATVLYADMAYSTDMVDNYKPWFSAEIYKAYLHCAAKIIRSENGIITSYDGDRIMAVFIGNSKNTSATRCGLKINGVVKKIINPILKNRYSKTNFILKQVVGIDTSKLFIARTGVRGSNDLVWVGRAANYAAKLSSESPKFPTLITENVYNMLNDKMKNSNFGENMWKKDYWNGIIIYKSSWLWRL